MSERRPPRLRRSWMYIGGTDMDRLSAAPACGADVITFDLEDFTASAERPRARGNIGEVVAAWKEAGTVTSVRINPLDGEGHDDLDAVMNAGPDVVMLPKVAEPHQIEALDDAVSRLEERGGLEAGATELVPNVELARGLIQTYAICRASPRVSACLVAAEDMAADLGAERDRDGTELAYVRARFHAECVAAGTVSIDRPYTWTDEDGLVADTLQARRLGYIAKSAVKLEHAAVINRLLTPAPDDVAKAQRTVDAFEAARDSGEGRVEVDGSLVEVPTYNTARRLLERAEELGVR